MAVVGWGRLSGRVSGDQPPPNRQASQSTAPIGRCAADEFAGGLQATDGRARAGDIGRERGSGESIAFWFYAAALVIAGGTGWEFFAGRTTLCISARVGPHKAAGHPARLGDDDFADPALVQSAGVLAFHRMRVDRELACDALALSHAKEAENQPYGRTIIKLLESFGCSAWAPSLAGTLESKNQMKERIRMIAKFKKTKRGPVLAASLFAGLGLLTLTDAQPGQGAKGAEQNSSAQSAGDTQEPPRIIATSPAIGATDVDPAIAEITVTFDHDMQAGFSWTGAGPERPVVPEGAKVHWRDAHTCVYPVKLEAGHYYRVGINSKSYKNFRSIQGVPAGDSALYFTTRGASQGLKLKTMVPQIVSMYPSNGAQDVSPALSELRVTFSVPMGGGMSWCGGGDTYPDSPQGKSAYWTDDHLTCVLPVTLKAGHTYQLGVNSPSHKNFQRAGGISVGPVAYKFRTME